MLTNFKNCQNFFNALKVVIRDKLKEVRTKSSHCDPYELGYTCATMKITESNKNVSFSLILKIFLVRIVI